MTAPGITRLLTRTPELEPFVAAVLARGAELRAAARVAFVESEPPRPVWSEAARQARVAFERAIGGLEAAGGEVPTDTEAFERAVEAVTAAVVQVRTTRHAFAPRRAFTSVAAQRALVASQQAFAAAWSALARAAEEHSIRELPWRLELASHCDPTLPVAELELCGDELPLVPAAKRPWGERCLLTGEPFLVESWRAPRVRFRSLDAAHHVLTPEIHAFALRLRAALAGAPEESAARDRLERAAPWLFDDYLAEPCHPSFARLGLLDFPSLAIGAHNLLTRFASRPLFASPASAGDLRWATYGAVRRDAYALARGLERLGVPPAARVGLLFDENGPELYVAELAAVLSLRATVALPATLADDTIAALFASAEVGVVVADVACAARLEESAFEALRGRLAAVVRCGAGSGGDRSVALASLLDDTSDLDSWRAPSGLSLATPVIHDDAPGHELARSLGVVEDPDDALFTILFTSGSTGLPKGTLVTRRRWAEEICTGVDLWPYVGASFQPSAIAGDRGAVWRALTNGGRVGFARRGAELFGDLAAIRPTLLDAPPVIWNTIHADYRRAIARTDLDGPAAARVRARSRELLGGRLAWLATGGAPSDEGVRRGIESLFGVPMVVGYGTTETGFIARDGRLLPGIEFRLVDRPELGMTSADLPLARGELAVRTGRTTARYLGEAEGASAGFTEDGYFLTGDLVELGPGRRVRVLGRARSSFKLAGAEQVSPEELERLYGASAEVEQIWIAAAPGGERVVAVVVPRSGEATPERVHAALLRLAAAAGLRAFERPAAVVLARREGGRLPWTVDNGLLTPSFKLQRRALAERYRDEIAHAVELARSAPDSASNQEPGIDTAARLRAVVAAILRRPVAQIDLERSFEEAGGDSLAALELSIRLEELFERDGRGAERLEPTASGLARMPLVQLAARLERRSPARSREAPSIAVSPAPAEVAPRPEAESVRIESQGDSDAAVARLASDDATALPPFDPTLPLSASDDVLVTGANGFLGVHLVDRLARELPAGARIFALVRGRDHEAACARLGSALAAASLPVPTLGAGVAARGARVVALAGSVDAPRLGLDAATWELLAREVGLVLHVAASVTGAGSYEELRAVNVEGTRHALELAAATRWKAFHLVSSLNVSLLVAGPGRGIADESTAIPEVLTAELVRVNTAYALTKWASERMVGELARRSEGRLRATISRPALLGWARATGCANEHDWLTKVLVSCLAVRAVPGPPEAAVPRWVAETEGSARGIDLVPVDFAAEAIARLGQVARDLDREPAHAARLFHVSNLAAGERGLLTLPRLLDLLVAAELEGGRETGQPAAPLELLSTAQWRARIEIAGAPALPLLDKLRTSIPSLPRTPSARLREAMGAEASDPGIDIATLAAFVRRARPALAGRSNGES